MLKDIGYVLALSVGSIVVLFLLTKLMGSKQLSQLTFFDYVIGITIGSIAAEMSTSLDGGFHKPLTAMITYGVIASCLSVLTNKSLKLRRFFDGRSMILYEDGKLFRKNLKKAKLNTNEFLAECRILGYYNLADIQTAILEPNGKISVLPKSISRPPTNREMNITPEEEKPPVTVILDGKVLFKNLKFTGNNEIWLKKELQKQGIKSEKDVIYASCDSTNNLSAYTNVWEMPDYDIFS